MTDLRDYQRDTVARVIAAIEAGKRRILVVAPTGSGKTVLGSALVQHFTDAGKRAIFLAHRRELITQASRKLHDGGLDHGILAAGFQARPAVLVQVASVQTMHARCIRSTRHDLPPSDLVLVDEAHHVRAKTYQQIIGAYPDAVVIGLTATPCRGDGRGLGSDFEVMIEAPQVPQLIGAGFLVPTRVYAPHVPDLDGVHIRHGDYIGSELEGVMNRGELIGDVVTHWHKLAAGMRTVAFATSVAHSINLRDEFRRSGVVAEHLDGSTPTEERDAMLARLASGTVDLITNCMVLTEGFDCPDLQCIVLARPTKSLLLYRQMVGRALRPAPGKDHALIVDHAGATFQHGFADEEIAWTLEPDQRAINKSQAARSAGRKPDLVPCPECKAVRLQGMPCSACGWRPRVKPQHVDTRDGDLALMDRSKRSLPSEWTQEGRAEFYRQLVYIGLERGYKSGWASHKYKEKFGTWPANKFAPPMVPDAAVRSWVRSRQIAFAKGMARRGAA